AWTEHDTVSGSTNSFLDLNLPCNVPFHYRTGAVHPSLSIISYSDSISLIPYDTIRPPAPNVLYSSVLDGKRISLQWEASVPDVKHYEIRIRSKNSDWQIEDTLLLQTSHVFTNLNTLDSTYFFSIAAIDSCAENKSEYSVIHSPVQLDGLPQNLSNKLTWSAYEGFTPAEYIIYRRGRGAWENHDTVAASALTYLDTGLQCNIPYYYRIGAVHPTLPVTSFSDSISLTPFDTIRPSAPIIRYATVADGSTIDLFWQKVPEKDVRMYEVRIQTASGPWQVADTVFDTYNYTFTGLSTTSTAYSFRVVAIDSCADNRSPESIAHTPVQLDGQPLNLSNRLDWSAYKGFETEKYYIYRHIGNWQLIDSVDGPVNTYTHTGLPCNVTVHYKVAALDKAAGYISYSDSISLTPYDTIKPPAPLLHYASVQDDHSIKVEWAWDKASDVKYFEVWRSENGGSPQLTGTVTYDSIFYDKTTDPQRNSYSYYVLATDSCNLNNRSEPSFPDRIINLKLTTGGCIPLVNLAWSSYADLPGGVDAYEVYRSAGSGFSMIKSLQSSDLTWTDLTVTDGVDYFYKIKAIDAQSGFYSYSDTLGVKSWIFPIPDTTGTVVTSVIKTGISDGAISVRWRPYPYTTDTFARGYRLYHVSETGDTSLIHDEKDLRVTNYTHAGINTSGETHRYFVKVYNLCDIEGAESPHHRPVNLSLTNENLKISLSWTGYEGADVQGYQVWRRTGASIPVLIATFGPGVAAYVDTNVFCHRYYSYGITALLQGALESQSDTVGAEAFDDTPPPVTDMVTVSTVNTGTTDGEIAITYSGNAEKNRSGYNLYRRTMSSSDFVLAATIRDLKPGQFTYTQDALNTAGDYYAYYIAAIDSCGNEAMPSDTHRVVYLKANAQSLYMQLDWTPYRGWSNWDYVLERKELSGSWQNVAILPGIVHTYRDSSVTCHIYYNYRIRVRETGAGRASLSNISGDTAYEVDLPVVPQLSRVTVTRTGAADGSVDIQWNPSASKDVAGYNLYHSTDGANWQPAATNITGLDHSHPGLNTAAQSYYYRLEAIDSCGNLSAVPSAPHRTILLEAASGNQQVSLTWNAYEGWPVERYDVFRNSALIASVNGGGTSYADTLVLCTEMYTYRIEAYSQETASVIYSSSSNTDSAKPYDAKAPAAPYLKTVTVDVPNKSVRLEWAASASFDARSYHIFMRSATTNRLTFIDSTTATSYVFQRDSITAPDCFVIKAADHCGNLGLPGNRGCIMLLLGSAKDGYNDLNWNPYEDWQEDVSHYNVYVNEDGKGWELIGTSAQPVFQDREPGDDIIDYCYQVEAIENTGGFEAVSRSTVVCLHQDPIIWVPNAFTADGNNRNDSFGPQGMFIRTYEMSIYDRWGQLVYHTTDGKPWDGTYKGIVATEGVYLYKITLHGYNKKPLHLNGTVTVIY
ncbi:MAG: gliding motility-associated C-terminal domain-containing protein, partial [Bacteroidota bacterium]|nr:gliding motility-associated C-terminal domain-containing protein [Bacteroidota bacterium]